MELGGRNRSQWARELGATNDRIFSDLEAARRTNYEQDTYIWVEQCYQWTAGSIAAVLAGGDPTPLDLSTPPESVPLGANVDPDVLADLAVASPAAIEAVRAVLKAAKGEQ